MHTPVKTYKIECKLATLEYGTNKSHAKEIIDILTSAIAESCPSWRLVSSKVFKGKP